MTMTTTNSSHSIESTLQSWLLDAQETINATKLSLTFRIPRHEARNLLYRTYSRYSTSTSEAYVCILYIVTHQNCKLLLQTIVKDTGGSSESGDSSSIREEDVYALRIMRKGTGSGSNSSMSMVINSDLKAAGLRACRESYPKVNYAEDSDGCLRQIQCAAIRPYSADGSLVIPDAQLGRRGLNGSSSSTMIQTSMTDRSGGKRKVTSAASFFGNAAASATSKAPKKTNDSAKDDKASNESKPFTSSQASNGGVKAKNQGRRVFIESDEEDEEEIDFNINVEEKKGKKNKTGIGNADDFMGDEDEDEEDMKEEEVRKAKREALVRAEEEENRSKRSKAARAAAEERKKRKKINDNVAANEDENEQERENKVGAMDNFVSNNDNTAPRKTSNMGEKYKRRKKMVQKTTTDAKGYLHTEFVEEWVDVPESDDEKDEEAENKKPTGRLGSSDSNTKTSKNPSQVSNKKPVPSSKCLKQTGLMGFFAKKK